VRIRANVSEAAARTAAIERIPGRNPSRSPNHAINFHAGDIVLLPIAIIAFWTLAYDLVLAARWPAHTITWSFLGFAISGGVALGLLWRKTSAIPGKSYRFHPSHLLLVAFGLGYAITALFVRRPNQDDVVYFHRALAQLLDLHQPIFLRQTSVDVDAAAFSPVHLTTSYEMLTAFLGHYLGINPLYCYQVVAHVCVAFSLPFVFYRCARIFGLDCWPAAVGALLGLAFLFLADQSPYGTLLGAGFPLIAGKPLESINTAGMLGFSTVSGYLWEGKPIIWILLVPTGLALSYRFLLKENKTDILCLTCLAIAGVGLSNTGLYLIPAVIGCSWLAFLAVEGFQREHQLNWWHAFRRGLYLAIPMVYPVAILVLLSLNIIPKPIDTRMFGPSYRPWCNTDGRRPAVARQRASRALPVLLPVCCVVALPESIARAVVDEKYLCLHLFSTCLPSPAPIFVRLNRSRASPAHANIQCQGPGGHWSSVRSDHSEFCIHVPRSVNFATRSEAWRGLEVANGMSVTSGEH
jgi:hypothetical protein